MSPIKAHHWFMIAVSMAATSCAFQMSSPLMTFDTTGSIESTSNGAIRPPLAPLPTTDDLSVLPPVVAMSQYTEETTGTRELPPLLRQMADERREFELNLGKAMDVLRSDYPNMLREMPDMSIYHDDLKVVDPSGVQLTGINNYKNSFRFLQTLVGLFYNTQYSSVKSRMVYDFARSAIRISWHVVLVPKVVGNRRNSVYIDGISIYTLGRESGKILEHRVEQMLINNTPVRPPYGVFTALMQDFAGTGEQRVPVGVGA